MALECCICMDVLLQSSITISSTPCGHAYHTPCLLEWITKSESGVNCPVCRRTFIGLDVVPLDVTSDLDITAITKVISEQVTLKDQQTSREELRPIRSLLQSFEPVVPSVSPDYPSDSDTSLTYYDEEPSYEPSYEEEHLNESDHSPEPITSQSDDSEGPEELNDSDFDQNELFTLDCNSYHGSVIDDFNDILSIGSVSNEDINDILSVGSANNEDINDVCFEDHVDIDRNEVSADLEDEYTEQIGEFDTFSNDNSIGNVESDNFDDDYRDNCDFDDDYRDDCDQDYCDNDDDYWDE